jgi:hypothetical protein
MGHVKSLLSNKVLFLYPGEPLRGQFERQGDDEGRDHVRQGLGTFKAYDEIKKSAICGEIKYKK